MPTMILESCGGLPRSDAASKVWREHHYSTPHHAGPTSVGLESLDRPAAILLIF